jgi:hypothetical protein|tara:strand:+ start:31 stop:264 length:234 start_codon:yes stop_codon:yes gene_type:complete
MDNFIEQGVYNSYEVICGYKTIDQIVNECENNSVIEFPVFFIEPGGEYTNEDIDMMIDIFEECEAYEECAELLKLKK